MPHQLEIEGTLIGDQAPCYVIAEIGVNHNGDLDLARRLIDAAARAGANAVKLQSFAPESLVSASARKAQYQKETTGEDGSQLDMLRSLALSESAHVALLAHARSAGITLLSTPFDTSSAMLLDRLGFPAYKVSSGDLTNCFLLEQLAGTGRPVLLSTGMATLGEVAQAVEILSLTGTPIALFHCVSNYPTRPQDCNLLAMRTLRTAFDVPVGFSDHTMGATIAIAAVAMGAKVFEKHITLDRALPGPDHRASIEPDEFSDLMKAIRDVEAARGDGIKRPVVAELEVATVGRRSLHYARALRSDSRIELSDLVALRPGHGLPPARRDTIVGLRLTRDVEANTRISLTDFQ